ncbi:MAG: porin [Sphingobacteriales bacterium]|nr:porin [Sphingobacteriales bacterium]
MKKIILLLACIMASQWVKSQFLMDMVDTSKEMGKSMLSIYKKFDNIKIGGYLQPQFQAEQEKGAKSFDGGDFAANVNNRFMLRRGRIRFDYIHFAENKGPSIQFVFQFDGTERGVFIRDFWGRVFENKYQVFALTAGMFARPFSYELNLSSSDRESPERGRMSQILMKTERDLGAMVSFEPRRKDHPLRHLKIDAGLFNGQGLPATGDFDSHKDFISRISLKPYSLSKDITLSAGASFLDGGFLQNSKYVFTSNTNGAGKTFTVDSSSTNLGKIAPRKYYGADAQLKIKHRSGYTEIRAEFMTGTQTATANSTETPASLLTATDGYYTRKFNGAYFYLLHNIFNTHHQLGIKYDWYDPNTRVSGTDIGKAGTNLNVADIKYSTLGFGYIHYITDNLKLVIWYEIVTNEKTALPGYTRDVKDNVFTSRLQFRF